MNKFSILRKLQLYMLGFGIAMGFVFPAYANFFVDWKTGMFPFFAAGCLIAGLTVGLVSFWFVKVILLKKLKEVSAVASHIENKDLSNTINFASNDDVGIIVNGLNKAIINIRELFHEMSKVFMISEQALSNMNNTAQNSGNKSSAIEKINSAITQVTNHTKEIEQQSDQILTTVKKGKQISECTHEKQKGTIMQVNSFSKIIDSLVQHSKNIAGILSIIEGIAGQTNILSLNASVEAARAGDAGKGFAVVATEIRKLASNTSESSQTIGNTVQLIRADVDKAYKQVAQISAWVNENNTDIESVMNQFRNIDRSINSSIQHNQSLVASVNQLNQLFSNVTNVFNDLHNNLNHLQAIMVSYKL